MLEQALAAGAIGAHGGKHLVGGSELVAAREDPADPLPVVVLHRHEVAAVGAEPGVACLDFVPEVGSSVAVRVDLGTGATVVVLVEGQEDGVQTLEPGARCGFGVGADEVGQRATGEGR